MNKVTIAERIFNVVRDTPGLTEENIHEVMSVDTTYKTSSGKSLVYRMLRARFLRKDRNGKFFTHIDAYKPLPVYKTKKKKPVIDAVAEAAKLNQTAQAQYRESAVMNAYQHTGRMSPSEIYKNVPIRIVEPKKTFWRKLRELFSD
jgi:hypothetical protein